MRTCAMSDCTVRHTKPDDENARKMSPEVAVGVTIVFLASMSAGAAAKNRSELFGPTTATIVLSRANRRVAASTVLVARSAYTSSSFRPATPPARLTLSTAQSSGSR